MSDCQDVRRERLEELLETIPLYRVDSYADGNAFGGDADRAYVTASLSSALEELAQRVDDTLELYAIGEDYARERVANLESELERTRFGDVSRVEERCGTCGELPLSTLCPDGREEREPLEEELEGLLEELEEWKRGSAFLEALHGSAVAWADVAYREETGQGIRRPSRGALEYLESYLRLLPRYAGEGSAPAFAPALVSPYLETFREPGSIARGTVFELHATSAGELGTLEELEEILPYLVEELEGMLES